MEAAVISSLQREQHKAAELDRLARLAHTIRVDALKMVCDAGASHIGSSFSMAELLAALYGKVLRIDPKRPDWPERDRFILSKGHGCAGLYAALAERGFFPRDWLATFYLDGGHLPGHATYGIPGVEVSTGSLGHGLAIAAGMALAARRQAKSFRAFALLSDGECDEGSTWEAAMFAGHHQLHNLVAVIDYNKI
jgi:transketolase